MTNVRKHTACVVTLCVGITIGILMPTAFVLADGFVSLVGIPGLDSLGTVDMQTYINTVYRIAIIAAALIAVIKLILAGAQYVLSGIVTDKEKAKEDIRGALVGLLIIIAAVTLLRTINPNIVNLPALEPIDVPPPVQPEVDPGIEEMCDPATGGCSQIECDYFDSPDSLGLIGWIPSALGADYLLNTVQCETRCLWLGGQTDASFGDSGTCYYPNDPEALEQAREAARQALIAEGIATAVVEFDPVPNESFVQADIDNTLLAYGVSSPDEIIGIYTLTAQEEAELLMGGEGNISQYNGVIGQILQGTCAAAGGTQAVKISQFGGGARYYCI